MTLRIVRSSMRMGLEAPMPSKPAPDDWTSRLSKLIPAEALALYGAGTALAGKESSGLWVLAIASLGVAGAVRFMATKEAGRGPQWAAIGIAMVSFFLWLAALPQEARPFSLGGMDHMPGILALVWTTVVPIFYKGD